MNATGTRVILVGAFGLAGACGGSGADTDASVVRLEGASGASGWEKTLPAPQFGDAVVAFGQVEVPGYAACSGEDVGRFAFDVASGESREAHGHAVVDVSGPDALVVDAEAAELRLVDSLTDELRWRSEFPCVPQAEGCTCTLDTIDAGLAGDLALVSHDPETTRAILDALRRDDGSPLWSASFDGARTASAVRNQTQATGPALVHLNGNGGPDRIVGIDRANGDALWTVELASDLGAGLLYTQFAPTLSGDVVVLPGCDETSEIGWGLVGIDSASGDILWRFETALADRSAVDHTGAYSLSGEDLVALEADTGAVRWRVPLATPAPTFHVAVDGERVYAVLAEGVVVAFDVTTGTERWRSDLPGTISTDYLIQMVASDGALVVVGHADITISSPRAATDRRLVRSVSCALVMALAAGGCGGDDSCSPDGDKIADAHDALSTLTGDDEALYYLDWEDTDRETSRGVTLVTRLAVDGGEPEVLVRLDAEEAYAKNRIAVDETDVYYLDHCIPAAPTCARLMRVAKDGASRSS